MIVTVTPNPALDLTWRTARLLPGESHRVDAAHSRAGGKGLNVARITHSFGYATRAIAPVAERDPVAAEFRAELADSGVPHDLVRIDAPLRRSVSIVDEGTGQATVLNERGTRLSDSARSELLATVARAAATAAVVVLSGSLPPETPEHLVGDLVRVARDAGARTIVDTSGPALLAAARAGADILKPNRAELAEATGLDQPLEGARRLVAAGARCVVVSLGEAGLLLVTADPERTWTARLDSPVSGNPTGAGDALVAALACAAVDGKAPWTDPVPVLTRAVAWSAAAVLAPLAGTVDPGHTLLAARVVVTPIPSSTTEGRLA